jgi:hypothetical protein
MGIDQGTAEGSPSVPRASGYSTCCAQANTLVVRWVDGRNYIDVADTIRDFMRRGVIILTMISDTHSTAAPPTLYSVLSEIAWLPSWPLQRKRKPTLPNLPTGPALTISAERSPAHTWDASPVVYRAMFNRIRLVLDSTSPPSLSVIAKAEGFVEAGGIQTEAGPAGCVGRTGLGMVCSINRESRSHEPHAFHPASWIFLNWI